jgi:hypothetical protein
MPILVQEEAYKTEGTSTTYGQDVHVDDGSGFDSSFVSPSVGAGVSPSGAPPMMAESEGVGTSKGVGNIASSNTNVKVVEKIDNLFVTECGLLSTFSPSAKSDIAIAAASTNKEATVVVSADTSKFKNPPPTSQQFAGQNTIEAISMASIPQSITGQLMNNVAQVVPNVIKNAAVIDSTIKSKPEVRAVLEESQKVDLTITIKSKDSETLDFNLIKIPNLELKLNYNFFEPGEEDIERQEDKSKDPLLGNRPTSVPRYVQLNWSPSIVTNPITGTELEAKKNEKFRAENFFKEKGATSRDSSSVPKSIEKSKKRTPSLTINGVPQSIVDVHEPEVAFNAVANSQIFPNSISTVINAEDQTEVLTSLPILEFIENI